MGFLSFTVNFLSLAALRLGLAELILADIKVKKKNCPKSENKLAGMLV